MASTDCQREGQATVEFGAKFDLSPNNEGYGRIEKISFAAYNESGCLIEAIERFKERTGYYQERVLADQIYWTRENRSYCKVLSFVKELASDIQVGKVLLNQKNVQSVVQKHHCEEDVIMFLENCIWESYA